MALYIKLTFDLMDDDNIFNFCIRFNTKEDIIVFIEKIDVNKQYGWGSFIKPKNINDLCREYVNDKIYNSSTGYLRNILQPKPKKIVTTENIDKVVNLILNVIPKLEKLRFKDYMPKYKNFILQKLPFNNELKLELYTIKKSNKYNSARYFDYYDLVLEKREYDIIIQNTFTVSHDSLNSLKNNEEKYVFLSKVDLEIYMLHVINKISKKSAYDYASDLINEWRNLFNNEPLLFSSRLNIQKYFNKEILDKIDLLLKNLIESNISLENKRYEENLYLVKISNEYIYPTYIEVLKTLLKKEEDGEI